MANNNDDGQSHFGCMQYIIIIAIACFIGLFIDACDGGIKTQAEIDRERQEEHDKEMVEFGKKLLTEGTLEREWYEENYLND